jgi:hypothetical protein
MTAPIRITHDELIASSLTTRLDQMVRELDALPKMAPALQGLRAAIYEAYVAGRCAETILAEQGA